MSSKHLGRRILIVLVGLVVLALMAFVFVFFAVKYGWTNTAGIIDPEFDQLAGLGQSTPAWVTGEEWETLAVALSKDQPVIDRVAAETGIASRLIVAMIVPEQLRLFYSEREIFKQIFSPLKILGNQTQFSWGVAGLKQETAKEIEERDNTGLLAFTTTNHDEERFNRIADEHDHYYSYLYVALFLKQIREEWQAAGFPIDDRPEILATLFNIGFAHSKPKPHPQVGGAAIEIGGRTYSFGRLAYEFYHSNELTTSFPQSGE